MGGSFRTDVPDKEMGIDHMVVATGKEGKGNKNEKMREDNKNRLFQSGGECTEQC